MRLAARVNLRRHRWRKRDEGAASLEGTDACFAPVLSFAEAPDHPQLRARGTFIEIDGVSQPAPAPRFSRSAAPPVQAPAAALQGQAAFSELSDWLGEEQLQALRRQDRWYASAA